MHVIAAKAVAFKEAKTEEFKEYQRQIIKNAQTLSHALKNKGYTLISGGTDNHLFLIDLTNKNLPGIEAQVILEKAGISLNRNMIPFDKGSAFNPSGIRIGTPSVTTRGMKESEMTQIAEWINMAISNPDDKNLTLIKSKVAELCSAFPIYKNTL